MEFTDRKKKILCEIVKLHIATGEPVGSKMLCNAAGLNLSSATVRNEMSDLCEMGYLQQPHTSAGRVPTAAGYRFYIKELLGSNTLSPQMQQSIDRVIHKIAESPENITANAGQALSDLTGFPAVSLTLPEKGAAVKRVELLPVGRRTALVVLITTDSIANSRLCRLGEEINPHLLETFENLAEQKLVGRPLESFTGAYLQSVAASAGLFGLALMPLLSAIFNMVEALCHYQLELKGEANMYSFCRTEEDARRMVDYIRQKDAVYSLLSGIEDPVGVVFGVESGVDILKPSSFVVAKFGGGENRAGKIGVMGPTRMAYEDLIPSVAYFARQLGKAIEQAGLDLED